MDAHGHRPAGQPGGALILVLRFTGCIVKQGREAVFDKS